MIMTEYPAVRHPDHAPIHPGAVLEDVLDDIDLPKSEIARLLGLSRQHLYDILRGRQPLSPATARRIGKAFGGSTGSWLRMQATYDAWHADREIDVSDVPTIKAA
jgi:addiction module HigA family antidote